VHDALAVRVPKRVRRLARDLQCVIQRQLTLATQAIPERLAFHVGHSVPELADRLPRIEHWENVGMLHASSGPDFPLETLGA
jgi:hypothetical protein